MYNQHNTMMGGMTKFLVGADIVGAAALFIASIVLTILALNPVDSSEQRARLLGASQQFSLLFVGLMIGLACSGLLAKFFEKR